MFRKTYSIAFNPNLKNDDLKLSLSLLFAKKKWLMGKEQKLLSNILKKDYQGKEVYLFNAGRSALYLLLKNLNLNKGDEVLLQSFTCVANLNSILWADLKAVFLDTKKDWPNLDSNDLAKKLSKKTKVLLLQHTFGYPADMDKILKFCQKHKIILIEDCAHSFNSSFNNKKIGTFGQASFFSFGRDKALSSVFGGALLVNDKSLNEKIASDYQNLGFPKKNWVFKILLYSPIIELVLKTYHYFNLGKFSLGKGLLYFFQKLNLLLYPVEKKEKQLIRPKIFPSKMSNAQACLALKQYQKLGKFNKKRHEFLQYWQQELKGLIDLPKLWDEKKDFYLLRLPVFHEKANKIIKEAHKKGLLLGNWYYPSIAPKGVRIKTLIYNPLTCPQAERLSKIVFNLPLCPRWSKKEQKKVILRFKKVLEKINFR